MSYIIRWKLTTAAYKLQTMSWWIISMELTEMSIFRTDANFFVGLKNWIRKVIVWNEKSWAIVSYHFIPFNSQLSISAIENDLNETDICVKVFHRNLMLRFFLPSILLMDLLFNQKQKLNLFKWKMRIFARKLEKIIFSLLLKSQHPFAEILWA